MFVVFFKQKTAYELRSSDWSPDVCSSDLIGEREGPCFGGVVGKAQRLDHLRQHRASAELLLRLVKARDADGLSRRGRASGQFLADDEDALRPKVETLRRPARIEFDVLDDRAGQSGRVSCRERECLDA